MHSSLHIKYLLLVLGLLFHSAASAALAPYDPNSLEALIEAGGKAKERK